MRYYVMGLVSYESVWEGLSRVPIYKAATIRIATPTEEEWLPTVSPEGMLQWTGPDNDTRYQIPYRIMEAAHVMHLRVQ